MALMIHRFDCGARDRHDIDSDFRHGLEPNQHAIHDYIRKFNLWLEDGTAIGMGLSTAVNRLKDSEAKSKIVILLTDGDNNAGYIKPMTAGEIARELDVKVIKPSFVRNGKQVF